MRGTPRRHGVNKGRSAGRFRHDVSKTHPRNVGLAPRRGGWRL